MGRHPVTGLVLHGHVVADDLGPALGGKTVKNLRRRRRRRNDLGGHAALPARRGIVNPNNARALVGISVGHHANNDGGAFMQDFTDPRLALRSLARNTGITRPQERVHRGPDIDERTVDARLDTPHTAPVDRADDARGRGAVMHHVPDRAAAQQRTAHLAGAGLDQDGRVAHPASP